MLGLSSHAAPVALQLARVLSPYTARALGAAAAVLGRQAASWAEPAVNNAPRCELLLPFTHQPVRLSPDHISVGRQAWPAAARRAAAAPLEHALTPKDAQLVKLYMAGCCHRWDELPAIAQELKAAGASAEELRGCVRHLVVFAGYAPCLAATLALHKARVLPEPTPAKVGGRPGDAFEQVYGGVGDLVRRKLHAADPALGEWIRTHLYGEIYSSPGLDLRQKQLLACAFLGQAAMPDQLYGHMLAALRFGSTKGEVAEAVQLGAETAQYASLDGRQQAMQLLDKAYDKYQRSFADEHSPPQVSVDPDSIRIPDLPPPTNSE